MRKAAALLAFIFVLALKPPGARAQCTPDTSIHTPGFYTGSKYCFVRDSVVEYFWQFKTDSIYIFGGDTVFIDSIEIQYLYNLPCGLVWNTNKSGDSIPNIFYPNENGCFTIFGFATDTTGFYPVNVTVDAWVDSSLTPTRFGLGYLHSLGLMVINSGDSCAPLDTSLSPDTSSCFVDSSTPYSPFVGIATISSPLGIATLFPNPFSESTCITFNSKGTMELMFKVYDVTGRVQYQEDIETTEGRNNLIFHRDGLPPGVYFYYLGDAQNCITGKMIVD